MGSLDVLVNCASHIAETPIGRISDEEWACMLRVHLGGTRRIAHFTSDAAGTITGQIVSVNGGAP